MFTTGSPAYGGRDAIGISTRALAGPSRSPNFRPFQGHRTTSPSRIHFGNIPRTEYHVYRAQGLLLVDERSGQNRPQELELHFHTNAVGCEIFLRKAKLDERYWKNKPPARRFVAAHHDVGRVDFGEAVRRWIDEVGLSDGNHPTSDYED